MKTRAHAIMVVALSVGLAACDGVLDLAPQASITDEVALSTPEGVQNTLVGAYDTFGGTNGYGGSFVYAMELYGSTQNEVIWNGTFFDQREVWQKNIPATNAVITGMWTAGYNTINRVNNVLSALDVVSTDPADPDRVRIEAEARFIRGTTYFELVRAFGKAYTNGDPAVNLGVPLITTPTRAIDEASNVSRATVAAIYTQIESDLTFAKNNLPTDNDIYATTFAASAMLARVHMSKGTASDYTAAANEANRVITLGGFSLEATFGDAFNQVENGDETVFSVVITPLDGTNNNQVYYASSGFGGRGDIDVADVHLDQYELTDVRRAFFHTDSGERHTNKFRNSGRNVVVVRLAEMHLTRAEANFRVTGTAAGVGGVTPLDDVNTVRVRASATPLLAVTLADIMAERRRELSFEGHIFHDMRRTGGNIDGEASTLDKFVFPIPEREILVNPNLQQNTGYN